MQHMNNACPMWSIEGGAKVVFYPEATIGKGIGVLRSKNHC
jgi:hypothetical protein